MGNLADSAGLSPDKSDITKGHNKVLAHLPVREQSGISSYPYRAPAIHRSQTKRLLIRLGLTWYHKTLARYSYPIRRMKMSTGMSRRDATNR